MKVVPINCRHQHGLHDWIAALSVMKGISFPNHFGHSEYLDNANFHISEALKNLEAHADCMPVPKIGA